MSEKWKRASQTSMAISAAAKFLVIIVYYITSHVAARVMINETYLRVGTEFLSWWMIGRRWVTTTRKTKTSTLDCVWMTWRTSWLSAASVALTRPHTAAVLSTPSALPPERTLSSCKVQTVYCVDRRLYRPTCRSPSIILVYAVQRVASRYRDQTGFWASLEDSTSMLYVRGFFVANFFVCSTGLVGVALSLC